MNKPTKFFAVFVFLLFCIGISGIAEEITLTTYYPAPYGAYDELSVKQLKVEEGVVVGATYIGTVVPSANALIVEGNVGIGTASPSGVLDVNGTVAADAYSVNGKPGASGVFISQDGKTITVENGIIVSII